MERILKILKLLIVSIFTLVVGLYGGAYVCLSTPSVQRHAKQAVEQLLGTALQSSFTIDRVSIEPLNKVSFYDVVLEDRAGEELLRIGKLTAGFKIFSLLKGNLVISNVQLYAFDIDITQESPTTPSNMQFVIDTINRLERSGEGGIKVRINNAVMRRGSVSYHILSQPTRADQRFDPNHLEISNLSSTLSLKSLTNDSTNIHIKRLSFKEQSGMAVDRLSLRLLKNREWATLSSVELQLPHSELQIDATHIDLKGILHPQQLLDSAALRINIAPSHIALADLSPLLPALDNHDMVLQLSGRIEGAINALQLHQFRLHDSDGEIAVAGNAQLNGLGHSTDSLYIDAQLSQLHATASGVDRFVGGVCGSDAPIMRYIRRLGEVNFEGRLSGIYPYVKAHGKLATALGEVETNLALNEGDVERGVHLLGELSTTGFEVGELLDRGNPLGSVALNLYADGVITPDTVINGHVVGTLSEFDLLRYTYRNIQLDALYSSDSSRVNAVVDDPNGYLELEGKLAHLATTPTAQLRVVVDSLQLHRLHLTAPSDTMTLSAQLHATFVGTSLATGDGGVAIDSLWCKTPTGELELPSLRLTMQNSEAPQTIRLQSELLQGEVVGRYDLNTLLQHLEGDLAQSLPSLFGSRGAAPRQVALNDLKYHLTLGDMSHLSRVLQLPITLYHQSTIEGYYNDQESRAAAVIELPKAHVGKKLLEDSRIVFNMNNGKSSVRANSIASIVPNARSLVSLRTTAASDSASMRLVWSNEGATTYCGELAARAKVEPRQGSATPYALHVDVDSSAIIMNDTTWHISPSTILVDSGKIVVDQFALRHRQQYLTVDGRVSKDGADTLTVALREMNLDNIFRILNIENLTFGGDATGVVKMTNLMELPNMASDHLFIDRFSCNHTLLGDLTLEAFWDNDAKGILLHGELDDQFEPHTQIDGYIYPLGLGALDLSFMATGVDMGFIQPFLQSIASNVGGTGYGMLRLFGGFEEISLEGDAYIEDLSFGVEFLNTTYSMSDSVHFTPHEVRVNNATLFDKEGHTARVNGALKHTYFRELDYDFDLYDIDNMLVFDVEEADNSLFYGSVYGSGLANIAGDEKKTTIDITLETEENTLFTFVVPALTVANDYQFITYVGEEVEREQQRVAELALQQQQEQAEVVPQAELTVNMQIAATPRATMQLLIDPNLGDMIRANGSGNIRMEFNTYSNVALYGNYEVERGTYNFNLQDFVSRDFSIDPGGTIQLKGDPLATELDIDAIYTTTANLSDLDNSFAEDKELTRTSVPVQTVLGIQGNMMKPDLGFSLRFPTLSQDIVRRVNNIITTDDMMNTQIIYLLALGQFYTPDYMNMGQSQGGELASVASSTLSSQLSNMLGQLSDNWNIGTNIRSDKGDFSDVEVELALSSQLLNNRLLFNGNFGYQDNPTTNTSFIGDFDLEYLLTKEGNLRLKAYNRYNDRNYYIKSAMTTQGVGVMYKREFNTLSALGKSIAADAKELYHKMIRWIKPRDEEE